MKLIKNLQDCFARGLKKGDLVVVRDQVSEDGDLSDNTGVACEIAEDWTWLKANGERWVRLNVSCEDDHIGKFNLAPPNGMPFVAHLFSLARVEHFELGFSSGLQYFGIHAQKGTGLAVLAMGGGAHLLQGDLIVAPNESKYSKDLPKKQDACLVLGFYRSRGRCNRELCGM